MKLGISSYTFTWSIGVPGYPFPTKVLVGEDLIKIAADNGLDVVQIADNYPLHLKTGADLASLKSTAYQNGVTIEVGTRGTEPDHLLQYIEIAKYLDARLLRTLLHSEESQPSLKQAAQWIRQVLPMLEKHQIVLAIENHDKYRASELSWLVKEINHPHVGICLDTVNSFGALEGPEHVLSELGPYIVNFHWKDFDIQRVDHQMGFSIMGCPAGEGRIQADWILPFLNRYNENVSVILELWTPYCGTIEETVKKEREWATKSIKYLQDISLRLAQ